MHVLLEMAAPYLHLGSMFCIHKPPRVKLRFRNLSPTRTLAAIATWHDLNLSLVGQVPRSRTAFNRDPAWIYINYSSIANPTSIITPRALCLEVSDSHAQDRPATLALVGPAEHRANEVARGGHGPLSDPPHSATERSGFRHA